MVEYGHFTTDKQRSDFLKDLDESDVDVTSWEADFIADNLDRRFFSPRQIHVIEDLYEKYGNSL